MRYLTVAAFLALSTATCAADVLDCRDYVGRYDDAMREVASRSPGNETDARRETAEKLVRDCRRQERREAREALDREGGYDCYWDGERRLCR